MLNDHGNYIVDHGKIMEKSWNFVFEFLWEPCKLTSSCFVTSQPIQELLGNVEMNCEQEAKSIMCKDGIQKFVPSASLMIKTVILEADFSIPPLHS